MRCKLQILGQSSAHQHSQITISQLNTMENHEAHYSVILSFLFFFFYCYYLYIYIYVILVARLSLRYHF